MANLELFSQKTMSSREIAELTGKEHNDVLKAIRAMEPAWVKVGGGNFSLSYYTSEQNKKLPMYELTQPECLYVATKFNDEARAKLVIRWQELELKENTPKFKIPQSYSEALRLAADKEEENQRLLIENKEKDKQLEEQAPAVLFKQSVEGSSTNISVERMAKILCQNGVDIGQNRLYDWFVENGYLIRHKRWSKTKGKYQNDYTMTQRAAELKVFFENPTVINPVVSPSFTKHTIKVTGKGEVYFVNKFLSKKKV